MSLTWGRVVIACRSPPDEFKAETRFERKLGKLSCSQLSLLTVILHELSVCLAFIFGDTQHLLINNDIPIPNSSKATVTSTCWCFCKKWNCALSHSQRNTIYGLSLLSDFKIERQTVGVAHLEFSEPNFWVNMHNLGLHRPLKSAKRRIAGFWSILQRYLATKHKLTIAPPSGEV